MTRRSTSLLAIAAAMAASCLPGVLVAAPQPYQRRHMRAGAEREPSAAAKEIVAAAKAKRARKAQRRQRSAQ